MVTSADDIVMMNRHGGGGATIAKSNKAIVMGVWDRDAKNSLDKNQNAFDVATNVEKVAKFLKEAGF